MGCKGYGISIMLMAELMPSASGSLPGSFPCSDFTQGRTQIPAWVCEALWTCSLEVKNWNSVTRHLWDAVHIFWRHLDKWLIFLSNFLRELHGSFTMWNLVNSLLRSKSSVNNDFLCHCSSIQQEWWTAHSSAQYLFLFFFSPAFWCIPTSSPHPVIYTGARTAYGMEICLSLRTGGELLLLLII